MLEHMEKKVSFDDFAKADAEVAQGGQMPGFAAEAQQACS
jgi:hypothetical protein